MALFPNMQYEHSLWSRGLTQVVGIDEVGRGCLAGPVVASAVIFAPDHKVIAGIQDSKQLSSRQRQSLAIQIKATSQWALGSSSVVFINRHGIVKATFKAMDKAIRGLKHSQWALVDGNLKPTLSNLKPEKITTIIKGDSLSYSIAAAGILAKVYRDELMVKLSKNYPHYGWEQNKGYGTAFHRQAILKRGPTPEHRTLFLRKLLSKQ